MISVLIGGSNWEQSILVEALKEALEEGGDTKGVAVGQISFLNAVDTTRPPNDLVKLDLYRLVKIQPGGALRKCMIKKARLILKAIVNDLGALNLFTTDAFLRDLEDIESVTNLRLNICSKLNWLETLIYACLESSEGQIQIPLNCTEGDEQDEIFCLFKRLVEVQLCLQLRVTLNVALNMAYDPCLLDKSKRQQAFCDILQIGGIFRDFWPDVFEQQLDEILSLALLEASPNKKTSEQLLRLFCPEKHEHLSHLVRGRLADVVNKLNDQGIFKTKEDVGNLPWSSRSYPRQEGRKVKTGDITAIPEFTSLWKECREKMLSREVIEQEMGEKILGMSSVISDQDHADDKHEVVISCQSFAHEKKGLFRSRSFGKNKLSQKFLREKKRARSNFSASFDTAQIYELPFWKEFLAGDGSESNSSKSAKVNLESSGWVDFRKDYFVALCDWAESTWAKSLYKNQDKCNPSKLSINSGSLISALEFRTVLNKSAQESNLSGPESNVSLSSTVLFKEDLSTIAEEEVEEMAHEVTIENPENPNANARASDNHVQDRAKDEAFENDEESEIITSTTVPKMRKLQQNMSGKENNLLQNISSVSAFQGSVALPEKDCFQNIPAPVQILRVLSTEDYNLARAELFVSETQGETGENLRGFSNIGILKGKPKLTVGKKEEEEENARSEKDDSPPIGRICGTTQIDGKNVDDKNNMKAIRMTAGEETKKEEKQEAKAFVMENYERNGKGEFTGSTRTGGNNEQAIKVDGDKFDMEKQNLMETENATEDKIFDDDNISYCSLDSSSTKFQLATQDEAPSISEFQNCQTFPNEDDGAQGGHNVIGNTDLLPREKNSSSSSSLGEDSERFLIKRSSESGTVRECANCGKVQSNGQLNDKGQLRDQGQFKGKGQLKGQSQLKGQCKPKGQGQLKAQGDLEDKYLVKDQGQQQSQDDPLDLFKTNDLCAVNKEGQVSIEEESLVEGQTEQVNQGRKGNKGVHIKHGRRDQCGMKLLSMATLDNLGRVSGLKATLGSVKGSGHKRSKTSPLKQSRNRLVALPPLLKLDLKEDNDQLCKRGYSDQVRYFTKAKQQRRYHPRQDRVTFKAETISRKDYEVGKYDHLLADHKSGQDEHFHAFADIQYAIRKSLDGSNPLNKVDTKPIEEIKGELVEAINNPIDKCDDNTEVTSKVLESDTMHEGNTLPPLQLVDSNQSPVKVCLDQGVQVCLKQNANLFGQGIEENLGQIQTHATAGPITMKVSMGQQKDQNSLGKPIKVLTFLDQSVQVSLDPPAQARLEYGDKSIMDQGTQVTKSHCDQDQAIQVSLSQDGPTDPDKPIEGFDGETKSQAYEQVKANPLMSDKDSQCDEVLAPPIPSSQKQVKGTSHMGYRGNRNTQSQEQKGSLEKERSEQDDLNQKRSVSKGQKDGTNVGTPILCGSSEDPDEIVAAILLDPNLKHDDPLPMGEDEGEGCHVSSLNKSCSKHLSKRVLGMEQVPKDISMSKDGEMLREISIVKDDDDEATARELLKYDSTSNNDNLEQDFAPGNERFNGSIEEVETVSSESSLSTENTFRLALDTLDMNFKSQGEQKGRAGNDLGAKVTVIEHLQQRLDQEMGSINRLMHSVQKASEVGMIQCYDARRPENKNPEETSEFQMECVQDNQELGKNNTEDISKDDSNDGEMKTITSFSSSSECSEEEENGRGLQTLSLHKTILEKLRKGSKDIGNETNLTSSATKVKVIPKKNVSVKAEIFKHQHNHEEEISKILHELHDQSWSTLNLPFTEMHYSSYSQQDLRRTSNSSLSSNQKRQRRKLNPNGQVLNKLSNQDRQMQSRGGYINRNKQLSMASGQARTVPRDDQFEHAMSKTNIENERAKDFIIDNYDLMVEEAFENDFYEDEVSLFQAYGLLLPEGTSAIQEAVARPLRTKPRQHSNFEVMKVPMLEDIQEIISQENSCASPAYH